MNCDKCADLLSEFIDERLPGETAAAVAAHLDGCANCCALEAELRATVSLLTGLERQTPDFDVAAAVQARLERKLLIAEPAPRSARARLTPWRFAGIGAAAAAVVLAALYVWMPPAANQVTPPEVATEHRLTTDGIAPEATLSQPSPAASPPTLAPAPAVAPVAEHRGAPVAAKPTETAGASPAGGVGGAAGMYFDRVARAEKRADVRGKTAATADAPVAGTGRKAALGREERADITNVPASPNAESADKLARARSAGGPMPGIVTSPAAPTAGPTEQLPRVPSVANAPSEPAREVPGKLRALGYISDAEAQSKLKAEVAQPPPASASYGVFARDEADAKKTPVPAVATYYFEGKSSDVTLEFLALLPAGKEPLPQGSSDLDALKAAAAGRNVSIVEFSDARVVLDYSVTPADDEKIVAALTAKAGLTRQVVLSTVASVKDESHVSQAEPARSMELKKENPQLASAKEEQYLSNAAPVLQNQIAAETKRGAVEADKSVNGVFEAGNGRAFAPVGGKPAARYRVIFIRKPLI